MTVAVLIGVGLGAAIWLIVSGLVPGRQPLDVALARLGQPLAQPAEDESSGETLDARLGARLSALSPVQRLVDTLATDLRVLGRDQNEQAAQTAVYGLVGLFWAPVVAAGGIVLGVRLPLAVPIWLALVGAAGAVVLSVQHVRQQAKAARAGFAHTVSAYCDVLAMQLSAGYELHAAVFDAAGRGSGRSFAELQDTLHRGFLLGEQPWESLARLGHELEVNELVELGSTLELASGEGASVADTLTTKAASMRERLVADTERQAAGATERMAVPGAMVLIGFLWLLAYPALHLIFQEAGG